jgi:hypothetical protein
MPCFSVNAYGCKDGEQVGKDTQGYARMTVTHSRFAYLGYTLGLSSCERVHDPTLLRVVFPDELSNSLDRFGRRLGLRTNTVV